MEALWDQTKSNILAEFTTSTPLTLVSTLLRDDDFGMCFYFLDAFTLHLLLKIILNIDILDTN